MIEYNNLSGYEKSITVEQLKKLLDSLMDSDKLYPNDVKNLLVVRDGAEIGCINIAEESYEVF